MITIEDTYNEVEKLRRPKLEINVIEEEANEESERGFSE